MKRLVIFLILALAAAHGAAMTAAFGPGNPSDTGEERRRTGGADLVAERPQLASREPGLRSRGLRVYLRGALFPGA